MPFLGYLLLSLSLFYFFMVRSFPLLYPFPLVSSYLYLLPYALWLYLLITFVPCPSVTFHYLCRLLSSLFPFLITTALVFSSEAAFTRFKRIQVFLFEGRICFQGFPSAFLLTFPSPINDLSFTSFSIYSLNPFPVAALSFPIPERFLGLICSFSSLL